MPTVKFSGFPRRVRSIPVPAPLFGALLEQIDDLAELKCALRILWLLQQKKGFPRFVTLKEARADRTLANALPPEPDAIRKALDACVRRGTLTMAVSGKGGDAERLYALNTEADRLALSRAAADAVVVGHSQSRPVQEPWDASVERPNIYALYEANIGMLSPIIAEELKEAEALYPMAWIERAFREAVNQNAHNWRYIKRILENWERQGSPDGVTYGKSGRHSKENSFY